MEFETFRYEREQLYREIWERPLRQVAKQYGVSDVALAKICRRLSVPRPGLGYWAKTRAGKATAPHPPLPQLPDSAPTSIEVQRPRPVSKVDEYKRTPPNGDKTTKTVVPASLRNPHPLVALSQQHLSSKGPRDELISARYEHCLDLKVSRAQLPRSLRILHALVKSLEKRGYTVEVTEPVKGRGNYCRGVREGSKASVTKVLVAGQWIVFGLEERQSMIREQQAADDIWHYPRAKFVPSGRLTLCLRNLPNYGMRKCWNDGKRQKLEDCLDEFIEYLPLVADEMSRRDAEREKARLKWVEGEKRREEERKRREEVQRQQEEEAERAAQLEDMASRWKRAEEIRAFVAEVERVVGCTYQGSSACPGLEWARTFADELDPLTAFRPGATTEEERWTRGLL